DLSQEHDIAAQMPEVVFRMKKQANAIYESVMADGPEWIAAQETTRTAPPKPGKKHNDLLARIDKNPLPKGYQGSSHQQYVESVMSKLKSDQRARVSELWREKRSRDPNMPNAGASYVKILAHVTEDAGDN
ncbi:MAG: hypothetical protein CMD99_04030, partial [Gammaproteobacteria bacterium]|nr:hypothetical protein [Gammaproteobacteria bacterium]